MNLIIVTGAAGFIGSCITSELNKRGIKDLILVDHFNDNLSDNNTSDEKKKNIESKQYLKYFDKNEFMRWIKNNLFKESFDCLIHMGACSSTTLQDAKYFEENNYEYTKILAEWSLKNNVRFIYASSAATYGDGSEGYSDDDKSTLKLKPLNLYGFSKHKFDLWVLENKLQDKFVGLKFFNVFGPNEYHKGDMRSVIAKSYIEVKEKGKIRLFKSYNPGYKDGEQKRDFVYVKDAVDVVMFFKDNKDINGIFNLGTGEARTWNDLAKALFSAVNKDLSIEYIDMPPGLNERYQYFTQADISKLNRAGYKKKFMPLETSVLDYSGYLSEHKYL
ncbi:MAG: ADP-glyceromanno-heptose 6-epimerase [Candidatus Omnitrophica bacterium]|nr:ADP-glyceromanno-heptose 6-epimerase [Candidatus Omnitrophota bacterium]